MNLTEGCIKEIMLGAKIENPIVQILNIEEYFTWRLVEVSDGVFFTRVRSALGRSALTLATSGELQPYSVVVLHDYNCLKMHSSEGHWMMLLISSMTILRKGDTLARQIGNPIPVTKFQFKGRSAFEKSLLEKSKTLPIAALNAGNNRWCIKARIVSKEHIQKSSEEFFNLELADSSGSISATAYNDACRKFYDIIEVNKVYLIRRYYFQNDETSSLKFRLILKDDSEIEPDMENIRFNFCTSRSFRDMPLNSSVDIIGICLRTSDLINSKDESRKCSYRLMSLSDPSTDVTEHGNETGWLVQLWDAAAEKFDISTRPVVAIKGAEIVEMSGRRYASVNCASQVFINPNIKEAREMEMLWDLQIQRLNTLSKKEDCPLP